MARPLYQRTSEEMPAYVDSLFTLRAGYLTWLAQTRQPWTWQTYELSEALMATALVYAVAWHAAVDVDTTLLHLDLDPAVCAEGGSIPH